MKKTINIIFVMLIALGVQAQDEAEYKITIDADPLINVINQRDLPGKAVVSVVLKNGEKEVSGGKLCNGAFSAIRIDEEPDIGKIREIIITINGLNWSKAVEIRNVKVVKTYGDDETKIYNFPVGVHLIKGNNTVTATAAGPVEFDFESSQAVVQAELNEEFELEGEFKDTDVRASGFAISKKSVPTSERKKGTPKVNKSGGMICTTTEYTASASFDQSFLTNPTTEAIYPGAIVYAEDIAKGNYTNPCWGAEMNPIKITTNIAVVNGDPSLEVTDPDLATVQTGMNQLLINQTRGDIQLQVNFEVLEVNSSEELSIALGGHFNTASASASASFKYNTTGNKSLKVIKFQQIYYKMTFVPKSSDPLEFFKNKKKATDIMESGKTPLYVSNVTFGRVAYFFAETKSSTSEIEAAMTASGKFAGTEAGAEFDLAMREAKDESKMSALIIGGDGEGAITGIQGIDGFKDMLENGGKLSKQSLGVPISYSLKFLSDHSIARVNLATNYTKRTCVKVISNDITMIPKITNFTLEKGSDDDDNECGLSIYMDLYHNGKYVKNIVAYKKGKEDDALHFDNGSIHDIGKDGAKVVIDMRKIKEYTIVFNAYLSEYHVDMGAFGGDDIGISTKGKVFQLSEFLDVSGANAKSMVINVAGQGIKGKYSANIRLVK